MVLAKKDSSLVFCVRFKTVNTTINFYKKTQLEENNRLILENGGTMEYVNRWVTTDRFPNLWFTVIEQIRDLA